MAAEGGVDFGSAQTGDVEMGDIAGGNIYNGVSSEHIVALLHELIGDTRQYRSMDLTERQRRQDEQDIHNSAVRAQIGQLQQQQRLTYRVLIALAACMIIALVLAIGLLVDRLGMAIGLLIAVSIAMRGER